MPNIQDRVQLIKQRITQAAQKSGRTAADITIVAASKTVSPEVITHAIEAGLTNIGENKIQEALPKIADLRKKYPKVTWHMLGHLQRNKVRQALEAFDIIQSLDSLRLAEEIQKKAEAKIVPVLVEVNTSGEESKFGVPLAETIDFVRKISCLGNLCVNGLMTIGPLNPDPERARPGFKKLKKIFDTLCELKLPNTELKYLSMGMSEDFEIAIEEGSNMVRVGRAIFGERS